MLIRYLGFLTHRRYRGFNELNIEGSDVIKNLPSTNVLFVANHQTYYADVVAMTKDAIINAVKIRMRSDVPLAFCMSGGVDSNS